MSPNFLKKAGHLDFHVKLSILNIGNVLIFFLRHSRAKNPAFVAHQLGNHLSV